MRQKRIAFCIAEQHLIPHGGIGQFAKAFCEMAKRNNWIVDLILDKRMTSKSKEFKDALLGHCGKVYVPHSYQELSYAYHSNTFAFSEAPNFEKMANFRSALMAAHSENLYDLIVCNTLESMPAVYALQLHDYIPVVFYTHNETMVFRGTRKIKTVFSEACNNFYNTLLDLPGIVVGTQTDKNARELGMLSPERTIIRTLPMPMPEQDLLEEHHGARAGVLFIGRWEPGKNPQAFVDLITSTNLPARILTNENGAKKFRDAFEKAGVEDVTYGVGLQGQEKVEFIAGSAVHFNPSLREAFGFAFFECFGHMPCVTFKAADWTANFPAHYKAGSQEDACGLVVAAYDFMMTHSTREWYSNGNLEWVNDQDAEATVQWNKLMFWWRGKQATSSAARIHSQVPTSVAKFIQGLGRAPGVEDVQSLYGNRHKYYTRYTGEDTFITNDEAFTPPTVNEKASLESLFD
jgi:glycosyltransferase involved in cell wall biosynthesis